MAKTFFDINSGGLTFVGLASAPADLADGDLYYNTSTPSFNMKFGGVEYVITSKAYVDAQIALQPALMGAWSALGFS